MLKKNLIIFVLYEKIEEYITQIINGNNTHF